MHIPIITIIPTTPNAFFKITPHPKTESTASPNIFPTTGIKLDTAAFAVLAVIPSILLLKVPSKDITPTNIVNTIPKNHIMLLLKNFVIFDICTLSEILEAIDIVAITKTNGIKMFCIIFPIKFIKNKIMGCTTPPVTMLPVYVINVIKIGINAFINPIILLDVSFINNIMSVKFASIKLTINMYCT